MPSKTICVCYVLPIVNQQGYFLASTANPHMIGLAFCFWFFVLHLKTMKPESIFLNENRE